VAVCSIQLAADSQQKINCHAEWSEVSLILFNNLYYELSAKERYFSVDLIIRGTLFFLIHKYMKIESWI
jgi:hypothetical protein